MLALMVILYSSWVFLLLEILSLALSTNSSIPPRYLLDSSIIQASSTEIFGFLLIPLDRWPNPSSQILCGLCLLDSFSIPSSFYQDFLLSIPFDLSSFCSRQKLDTSSIYRAAFSIYILRFNLVLNHFKYLDLSLFSLDLKTLFSPKTFSHS